MQAEKGLPWRSWWDGPGGPIARGWNVAGLPTLFLLDRGGAVRRRFDGPPAPDELGVEIDRLLREAGP